MWKPNFTSHKSISQADAALSHSGRRHFLERPTLNFPGDAFRQVVYKENLLRNFEVRQTLARMVSEFQVVSHEPSAQRNKSDHSFTMGADRIGNPDYANLEHRGVSVNRLLYLLRGYVDAVANDDFFLAAFEPDVSIGVAPSQITTMEPSVPQHLSRRRGIIPVSGKDCRTPHGDLPDLAIWHILAVRI